MSKNKKKILFVTSTRADYGKLKSLIIKLQANSKFQTSLLITGTHLLKEYGNTWWEIKKNKIKNYFKVINQSFNDKEDKIFIKSLTVFNTFLKKYPQDLIVIHGDRLEPLAMSIIAMINNTKIGHIEGGEVSGTKDEIIRHSISKIANFHFVSNLIAKRRLIQLGESIKSIHLIGSPEVDIINSKFLPSIECARKRYGINFSQFSIMIYHGVTGELQKLNSEIAELIKSLKKSKLNYIIILPNNDPGSDIINKAYLKLKKNKFFVILPSIRFEHYLTLLKNADFIIGNSSSGVREAPNFGTPTINIGSRQNSRSTAKTIINCEPNFKHISKSINKAFRMKKQKSNLFGKGKSAIKFEKILLKTNFNYTNNLKKFRDIKIKWHDYN